MLDLEGFLDGYWDCRLSIISRAATILPRDAMLAPFFATAVCPSVCMTVCVTSPRFIKTAKMSLGYANSSARRLGILFSDAKNLDKITMQSPVAKYTRRVRL